MVLSSYREFPFEKKREEDRAEVNHTEEVKRTNWWR